MTTPKKPLTLKQQNKKEYGAWKNMRARCTFEHHKQYNNYGGRGIEVSEEFINSFETFLDCVGSCPKNYSLDRINNNGNYERGNLRWASRSTQNKNTRSCKKYQVVINSLKTLLGILPPLKICLPSNKTHSSLANTKVFKIWGSIKGRCFKPKHKNFLDYGGRGITMHEDFQISYYAFLSHVGEAPDNTYSLDRIDNDKGYTYGNLRWVKIDVQANNRRTVAHSEKQIKELVTQCEEKGISYEGVLE